jgi:GTPase
LSVFNRNDDDGVARGARALVVCPESSTSGRSAQARLDEASGLAEAIGIVVKAQCSFKIRQAKPATLFGSGQVIEIAAQANVADAELTIIDAALTPVQQRGECGRALAG